MEILEGIKNTFTTNALFQGGFLLGIFGTIMALLKNVPKTIYNSIRRRIVYSATIDESDNLFDWFESWLTKNYGSQYNNVMAIQNDRDIKYKQLEDRFIIRYKGRLIQIIKNRTKLENASNIYNSFYSNFVIRGFFMKSKIKGLLNEVRDLHVASHQNIVSLHYYSDNKFVYISTIISKEFNRVIIKDKQKLIDDIDRWVDGREWYLQRSIPYKRGYLFYGKPGNGKTSTAMTIAKMYNRNLYVINLNGIGDDELKHAFMLLNSGSILLIEDIDCAFNERDSNNSKQFSFSTLLNCLDGVFSTTDIITIFTTNHPEKLDPALIRAGRIDFKFEISTPDPEHIEEYLEMFYGNKCIMPIESNDEICMADVQNICLNNEKDQLNTIKEINTIYGKFL